MSVIIPVKNEERRISTCLKAVFASKLSANFEVIVVDNGSTDKTVEIAQSFGCEVLYAPYATISKLRNIGAERAKGSLFAFVDADIEVSRLWAEVAVSLFEETKSLSCVTGKIEISPVPTWVERTWKLNRTNSSNQHFVSWASSMNMIIKKCDFIKINGFNETLVTCEDVDLSYRLRQHGLKILYDHRLLVTHHGEAKTLSQFFKKERWRGSSALDGILAHKLNRRELFYLFQIQLFLISIVIFIYGVIKRDSFLMIYSCMAILFFPLLRAFHLSFKNKTIKPFFQLLLVWIAYYTARGIALLDNITRLLTRKPTGK